MNTFQSRSTMSQLDEARYGRACLLVLNVCPFTLRHVICDFYTQHGSLSFQEFLLKQKHNLFHLLQKSCCCRRKQSRTTPMYRSQWEILYMRNTSPCQKGQQGDCPCQHDAKPGVTTDVMNVTLCCLMIRNTCPGINIVDVDTIRETRNNLIHAESAHLDQPTYNIYWNSVKTAILALSHHVCILPTVYTDTMNKILELENRVMDPAELGELKKLIIDEKRCQDLEKNVDQVRRDLVRLGTAFEQEKQICYHGKKIDDHGRQIDDHARKIGDHDRKIDEYGRHIDDHGRQIDDYGTQIDGLDRQTNKIGREMDDQGRQIHYLRRQIHSHEAEIKDIKRQIPMWRLPEFIGRIFNRGQPNISKLRQTLIKINDEITQLIQLSPLQERGEDEMPLEMLYASVVIREDLKYAKKAQNCNQMSDVTPDTIFKIDGELARNVYMLGDAAHGKTTYCLWLLRKWCNAQQIDSAGKLNGWEKALLEFDFVFLLQFRNVNPNLASVTDMICQDIFESDMTCNVAVRHVLSSDKYRSLIIMDGLDEWNPYEETKRQLTCERMPKIPVSSNVSCFISMRPWVFPTILKKVKTSDRVIEILGLSETGMDIVIQNVLLYHYKLKDDPTKYTITYNKIIRHLKEKNLKSFMQIPLLAVVCVQIWYKEKQVGDSLTSFYAVMVDMLIERADHKYKLQTIHDKTVGYNLPKFLSEKENIESSISVLLKLGKVAYEGLLSYETNLVFQRRKLQNEIGEAELQFALDVGLISQKEASSLVTKKVSVYFFHKSIQEFLAVIYIVTQKNVSDSFCKHLSKVKDIMEFSNVIMFICGMSPSLGSVTSQRVVSVTDSDGEICKYRDSSDRNSTVKELYKLQVSWYRELQYGQTDSKVAHNDSTVTQTESPVTFHASDVYLYYDSEIETVRVTRKLLSNHHVDIRSLLLYSVPIDGEACIPNAELNDFLSNTYNTRSLSKLYIYAYNTNRSINTLCVPTLRCLYLRYVTINTDLDDNVCLPLLTNMTQLRVLWLSDVTLGEGGLGLSPNMVHIERIRLVSVKMSATVWEEFFLSVSNIQHRFDIKLRDTNIDNVSKTMIRSSPDFTITHDDVDWLGRYVLHFTRVWPLSQVARGNDCDDFDYELLYTRL